MNFEIHGVGFINKGAELMMRAIYHQIKSWDVDHQVAVNLKTGNASERLETGISTIPWADYKRVPFIGDGIAFLSNYIPEGLLNKYNFIASKNINVVFDASGFAYSDVWGTEFIEDLLKYTHKWKSESKKIFLLPQAFGPFEIRRNKLNMKEIISNVELIYARDPESFNYLKEMDYENHKIRMAPDFTITLEGNIPDYIDHYTNLVCLIPNFRMVDKYTNLDEKTYRNFFLDISSYLIEHDYEVVILIHEKNDQTFGEELKNQIGKSIKLFVEDNALLLKGIIGKSKLVVGSRYHGLVSSLSQGVPSLGTSWSHKYESLFKDYGCSDCLLKHISKHIDVASVLNPLLVDPARKNLILQLKSASQKQKIKISIMWNEIYNNIFDQGLE
jgi:colanic acid/amylovoran biosynthesis protein